MPKPAISSCYNGVQAGVTATEANESYMHEISLAYSAGYLAGRDEIKKVDLQLRDACNSESHAKTSGFADRKSDRRIAANSAFSLALHSFLEGENPEANRRKAASNESTDKRRHAVIPGRYHTGTRVDPDLSVVEDGPVGLSNPGQTLQLKRPRIHGARLNMAMEADSPPPPAYQCSSVGEADEAPIPADSLGGTSRQQSSEYTDSEGKTLRSAPF